MRCVKLVEVTLRPEFSLNFKPLIAEASQPKIRSRTSRILRMVSNPVGQLRTSAVKQSTQVASLENCCIS